jgi:hypothetical protein
VVVVGCEDDEVQVVLLEWDVAAHAQHDDLEDVLKNRLVLL